MLSSKYLIIPIGVLFIIFILLFLYIFNRLHSRVQIHIPQDTSQLSKYNLKFQSHTFKSADGYKLSGSYLPHPKSKLIVILVHGYGFPEGGKGQTVGYADFLYKAGYSSFSFDLRSFGESEGDRITFGINEWKDAEAAYDYVKSQPENKDKKIGFLGVSMGATTTLIQAGRTGKGDFIIASVPYASINKLFAYQLQLEKLYQPVFYPLLQLSALIEFGPDYNQQSAESVVKNITKPKLFIAAQFDDSNNPEDTKYLFKIAPQPKEFWLAKTKHDVFEEDPEGFRNAIITFLKKLKY